MSKQKFNLPLYRKQQPVMCPSGKGVVDEVRQMKNGFYYLVNGNYYHEIEIKKA